MGKHLIVCLFMLISSCLALAKSESNAVAGIEVQKLVQISKGRSLYVHYTPGQVGYPTVVLLNGLTYSTEQWGKYTAELNKLGLSVLRYDMKGMGQTLLNDGYQYESINIENQVDDLAALLQTLKIQAPYHLVGLSYGGGIGLAFTAKFPKSVKNLVLMAPYTEPLETQDQWIRSQIWYVRKVFPFNPASDDELYEYFLKQIIYSTYPSAEPIVLEHPYKLEGVYRMVQGIRKWTSAQAVNFLPASSVHLMVAGQDQYVPRKVMTAFWESVPESAKASYILVNNAEHKIPEDIPRFSANWTAQIVLGNQLLNQNKQFDADAYTGVVRYEGGSFQLPGKR